MEKLWKGRFKRSLAGGAEDFNSSIAVDKRLYECDIEGSIAHVTMLANCGILTLQEGDQIKTELSEIKKDIESGKLVINEESEDIHTFVENELTIRLGELGKKLHTARSRNDQVALDTRLFLKKKMKEIEEGLKKTVKTITDIAEENIYTFMPGYTHLQIAQPITFAHHIMAYAFMFLRDKQRMEDCYKRTNLSPLGSCALAGTTYPIKRNMTAALLGFDGITENSIDGVSDRDYLTEFTFVSSLIMMHLSRFCEEIILWSSREFAFIELDDGFSTGSSIMPQKKNPDIAELIRGKTGRVYGNLMGLLTLMKGLPLAYNKDMQEDKEFIFDSADTVINCLNVFCEMIKSAKINKENMEKEAKLGFINATDCADYLTKKGIPFRTAYNITGKLVAYCLEKGKALNDLTIEEFKSFSEIFEKDIFSAIELKACINGRRSEGGPAPESVKEQIEIARKNL